MNCRNCQLRLKHMLLDLGSAPLSNAYLTEITLRRPEKWFPLRVFVCEGCWLVQAEAYSRAAEIFNDEYAYFSSFSEAWMTHARVYFDMVVSELGLGSQSFVVEVASNDGYLLRHFVQAGIPCLGVEPTSSTASAARLIGVPTLERFFGEELARDIVRDRGQADLVIANNVFAHVPDPIDFLMGLRVLLKDTGVATLEFPHLVNLVRGNQFDTVYHEHFAYLSLTATSEMASRCGLEIVRVEDISTHGGSLRVFVRPTSESVRNCIEDSVPSLLDHERVLGVSTLEFYGQLQVSALKAKNSLLEFLLSANRSGQTVCGYGAAAKGNTLLNFAGIRPDLLPYVVDKNPAKVGKYLPGSRIPIYSVETLLERRPHFILILPWNIKDEIKEQLKPCKQWGARFVTAIPDFSIE